MLISPTAKNLQGREVLPVPVVSMFQLTFPAISYALIPGWLSTARTTSLTLPVVLNNLIHPLDQLPSKPLCASTISALMFRSLAGSDVITQRVLIARPACDIRVMLNKMITQEDDRVFFVM